MCPDFCYNFLMPAATTSQTAFRSFLYGGASMLLLFDLFFLLRALITDNFVPIVPIVAGIFTAAGLLFLVYAEHQSREQDKRDHRRISRVAHQLESPLRALEENISQMSAAGDKLPSELRIKLKHMETKTKVLLENVRDVFLTLQAQDHPVSQEVRTYDLCVLVEEAYKRLLPLAQAKNVELISKAHCQNASVRVDRRLFLLTLSHLIDNAITYTMTPGVVNIAVIKSGRNVKILVQDRGVGIKEKDVASIFTPFFRGENAADYEPDGIGVGLALSRMLVREWKGKISWRNRPRGMGSEFEIILPLVVKK